MALGLTNLDIKPTVGNAALLPNQPIIQGCKVLSSFEGTLIPGDVVKLVAETSNTETIVVTKATQNDLPCGVVVGNEVKTGFKANEYVSVFPIGSFVYVSGASTDIACGSVVGVDESGDIDVVTTTGAGVIGIAWTKPKAAGGIFILQVKPSVYGDVSDMAGDIGDLQEAMGIAQETIGGIQGDIETIDDTLALKQNNLNLGSGLTFTSTTMYAWAGDIEGKETVYTAAATPEATGNTVYYLKDGVYTVLVNDATYADSTLSMTISETVYNYSRSSDDDRQDEFLNTVAE